MSLTVSQSAKLTIKHIFGGVSGFLGFALMVFAATSIISMALWGILWEQIPLPELATGGIIILLIFCGGTIFWIKTAIDSAKGITDRIVPHIARLTKYAIVLIVVWQTLLCILFLWGNGII